MRDALRTRWKLRDPVCACTPVAAYPFFYLCTGQNRVDPMNESGACTCKIQTQRFHKMSGKVRTLIWVSEQTSNGHHGRRRPQRAASHGPLDVVGPAAQESDFGARHPVAEPTRHCDQRLSLLREARYIKINVAGFPIHDLAPHYCDH